MSQPAIVVRDLHKRYGDVHAVAGIDLTVRSGQTVAVLGPNGAGKTSLVECCMGYRRPDQGHVQVLGQNPLRADDTLRARVGVMLQEGGIYPQARPAEMLRLFAALHADPLDPDELLETVGLTSAASTAHRDLSGGQQQRLALALALVGRPEVVFLDEPTAGLDPSARHDAWRLVRGLQRDGTTVVLTTHLLDEAEALADRVVIIDGGRIVAQGTPDELTHRANAAVTFSAAAGLDLASLSRAVGHTVVEESSGHYRIDAAGTPTLIAELTAWLSTHEVSIGQLNAGQATLEEVFLRLTAESSLAAGSDATPAASRRSRRPRRRR